MLVKSVDVLWVWKDRNISFQIFKSSNIRIGLKNPSVRLYLEKHRLTSVSIAAGCYTKCADSVNIKNDKNFSKEWWTDNSWIETFEGFSTYYSTVLETVYSALYWCYKVRKNQSTKSGSILPNFVTRGDYLGYLML